jgi:hypothetical protein
MQDAIEQGMGLNYRRRVVYRALTQCFADEARARRYFTLWNREFSTQAHVALARFVSAIASDAGLDAAARGRLQRALHESLTLRYEQLARVPDSWMPAANQTGEFPVLPGTDPASVASPATGRVKTAEQPTGARADPPPVQRALQAPHLGQADAAPVTVVDRLSADARSIPSMPIERADRILFRAMAEPMIVAILADTDPHPGLLEIALADLAQSLDAIEYPAHRRLAAWARARFLAGDLPVMADTEGYRLLLTMLRRLLADLDGEAVADRITALAVARAESLPQARLFAPSLLI